MDKLKLLYNTLDKARKMNRVKTEVELKINYNNKIFNRNFVINIDGENSTAKSSRKSVKLKKRKTAYAMMFIDMLSRINVYDFSSQKIISLKIKNFDELPLESNEIIKEHMHSSKGVMDKLHYAGGMLANGSSASDLLNMVKEFKKLDVSLKEVNPKAVDFEVEINNDLNLNGLKFYGEGINIEDGKAISIEFKEKFNKR